MASDVPIPATPKQKPTRAESKAEVTTAAALEIIESEAAARKAKTERLRAARLAAPPEPAAPRRRGKK